MFYLHVNQNGVMAIDFRGEPPCPAVEGTLPVHVWAARETKCGRKARVCPVSELGWAEEPGRRRGLCLFVSRLALKEQRVLE